MQPAPSNSTPHSAMRRSNRSPCGSMKSTFDKPTVTIADGASSRIESQCRSSTPIPSSATRPVQFQAIGVAALLGHDPQHPFDSRKERGQEGCLPADRPTPEKIWPEMDRSRLGSVRLARSAVSRVPLFRHQAPTANVRLPATNTGRATGCGAQSRAPDWYQSCPPRARN